MKSSVTKLTPGTPLIIALWLGAAASAPGATSINEMPVWDHTFDSSLVPPWDPFSAGWPLACDRNGRLVIFDSQTSQIRRLNRDGSHDPGFAAVFLSNNFWSVGIAFGAAIAFDSADRILVKDFHFFDGQPAGGLRRLNPDGSLDTTFAPARDGGSHLNGLAVQSDDRVLVLDDDGACCSLLRLNVDGSLEETFHAPQTPDISLVRITADDRVLVISASISQPIRRLNTNGAVDLTFHSAEFTPHPNGWLEIVAATLQPDGKILVAGQFQFVDGLPRSSIVRLNADGTVDETFVASLEWDDRPGRILEVAVDQQNRVVVAGEFNRLNGQLAPWNRYWSIARLNPDGTRDSTFGPYGIEAFQQLAPDVLAANERFSGGGITQVFPQADGNLLVGGYIALNTCVEGHLVCPDIFQFHSFVARMYGESPTNSFEFTVSRSVVSESQGTAIITVRRMGDTTGFATVDYATGDGSAVPGQDFEPPTGTLTFAPLELFKSFTVSLLTNEHRLRDTELSLTLSNATGVQTISRPKTRLWIVKPFGFRALGRLDGASILSVFGSPDSRYMVEYSPYFGRWANWNDAASVTLTNSEQSIIDTIPDQGGQRFYRLRRVAPDVPGE
jgi:uncharacterized delta-60 repeat protein